MKKAQIFILFWMFSFCGMNAQETPSKEIIETPFEAAPFTEANSEKEIPYDGTYQIVIKKGAQIPKITSELIKVINNNRGQSDSKKVVITSDIYLVVLSLDDLNNKRFKPEEKVVIEEK